MRFHLSASIDPGGHSHWKGVWGCAAVMTPFFQASRRSLAHQFTLNAPLLCTLFSIFRNFLHFQPCFDPNSSSLDPNFSKFSFSRPPFFQENPLPRPYIFKPAWHTPTKKKVECPPGYRSLHSLVRPLPIRFLVGKNSGNSLVAYRRHCSHCRYRGANLRSSLPSMVNFLTSDRLNTTIHISPFSIDVYFNL